MLTRPGGIDPARCPQLRHAATLAPTALFCVLLASAGSLAATPVAGPEGPQSIEDRGFAIILTNPVDPWLHGRQAIRIEVIIPREDKVEQVDFFVDRHLVFVDTDQPYATTFDFGPEIRRHTIEVKALTHDGRRARVSFVSRTADPAENAPGRVITFTTTVRDATGRPVDRLDVSDFAITEGTTRQDIVHFLPGPAPATIGLVVDPLAEDATREPLRRFLHLLPAHQAVALFGPEGALGAHPSGAAIEIAPPEPQAAEAAVRRESDSGGAGSDRRKEAPSPSAGPSPFSYDTGAVLQALDRATPAPPAPDVLPADSRASNRKPRPEPGPHPFPAGLSAAATAIGGRGGPRLLLIFAAVAAIGDEPFGPPFPVALKEGAGRSGAAMAAKTSAAGPAAAGAKPEPDPFTAAIDAARRSGAALHVIALPAPSELTWVEAKAAERALRTAAEESGGGFDVAADGAELERALTAAAERLRHQYIVSYVSGVAGKEGFTPLTVEVRGRGRTVEAPRSISLGN
jgi:hypothetical protein